MPPGFHCLIATQFTSALADNALLIVTIALLDERGMAPWWAPLLKFGFTLSYVFLAPIVGPLADAMPKARLMGWMNGVKIAGVLALLAGVHPVLAFAIVGCGAAAYAPAKYGLVTDIVGARQLVAANGWIEASVVFAALIGTTAGGLLVSEWLRGSAVGAAAQAQLSGAGFPASSTLSLSLIVLLGVYMLSSVINLCMPDGGARYPACRIHPFELTREFIRANRLLWRDTDGGLSLAVTTIFWGVGATLQFAVLRWAVDSLGMTLGHATYLQAVVAIGVVAGAAFAGRHVALVRAKSVLPFGVLLGLLIPAVASSHTLWLTIPLLVLVGTVGGVLVVPLNALLQHRGFQLLSAGRSIAVQGFSENLSILCMLAAYSAMIALEVPIVFLMWGFGLAIATAIAAIMLRERQQATQRPTIRPA